MFRIRIFVLGSWSRFIIMNEFLLIWYCCTQLKRLELYSLELINLMVRLTGNYEELLGLFKERMILKLLFKLMEKLLLILLPIWFMNLKESLWTKRTMNLKDLGLNRLYGLTQYLLHLDSLLEWLFTQVKKHERKWITRVLDLRLV